MSKAQKETAANTIERAKAEYAHRSKIGGQALIEGIMMKGAFKGAMACRLPNGEIDLETWDLPVKYKTDPKTGRQKIVRPWYISTPLVRGCVSFVTSMIDAYRCLMKAAEKQVDEEVDAYCEWKHKQKIDKLPEEEARAAFAAWFAEQQKKEAEKKNEPFTPPDEEATERRREYLKKASEHYDYEEPSRFEKWLDETCGETIFNIIMVIATVLSAALAVGLFVVVPKLLAMIPFLSEHRVLLSICEGAAKILLFVGYMAVTGLTKSIRRTYEYHGAEHKTIACFEAALPLTVENVKKQTRFHPRCGTSFIFLVLLISIFFGCFNPFTKEELLLRIGFSLLLLPLVMGVSYEAIRYAGRKDNMVTKILSAPGLWMQRITTKEPDASQIECAIAALKPCVPENMEDDEW